MLNYTQTKSGLCIIHSVSELCGSNAKIHYFRNIPYVSDVKDIEQINLFLKTHKK